MFDCQKNTEDEPLENSTDLRCPLLMVNIVILVMFGQLLKISMSGFYIIMIFFLKLAFVFLPRILVVFHSRERTVGGNHLIVIYNFKHWGKCIDCRSWVTSKNWLPYCIYQLSMVISVIYQIHFFHGSLKIDIK